jgi:hypothetical protein
LVQKLSRIKVYNELALPILLYGSETWALRKRIKNRNIGMRFFRTAGYTDLTTEGLKKFWKNCE